MNRTLLVVVMLCGCGPTDEAPAVAPADDGEDLSETLQELSARSPSDRVVVWQQNIEAMKAASAPAYRLTNAMLSWPNRPDIVLMQEAWQKVLCGDYRSDVKTPDVTNWKESPHANGLATACRLGRAPVKGSVLHKLGATLWGGVENVGHRRPFNDEAGSTSRTGTAVAWDSSRFVLEDAFEYDDGDVPGCSSQLEEYLRVAVLLRDTRRTADPHDDVRIAVASAHYGSTCRSANNLYVGRQMTKRWGANVVRIFGGDFNARVDETSSSYAARRAERERAGWYRATLSAGFVDAAASKHQNLCSEWTYPNVASCAQKTDCSATCPGFGIGGRLDRLDYLFVAGADAIASAQTDDVSAAYSDHKGVRVVIKLP